MSDIKYYIHQNGKAIGLIQEIDYYLDVLRDEFATSLLVERIMIHKKQAGEPWTHFTPVLGDPFEIHVMQGDKLLLMKEAHTTAYRISAESESVVIFEDVLLLLKPTHYDDRKIRENAK